MSYLTREEILSASDQKFKDVETPEWGGTVRLKSPTGVAKDAFDEVNLLPPDKDGKRRTDLTNYRAKVLALCAVDGDGAPLFTVADAVALGEKNGKALARCFEAAQELMGDVEALVKNSGTGQDAGSS